MTTKLIKETIEKTLVNGVEVEKTIAVETAIMDGKNEVGRLHVNQWGGNFNLNTGQLDVQAVNDGIINVLNPQ